jgi:undecaprenyl-diphosphatase
VDWRAYHAINTFVAHHSWLGNAFKHFESVAPVVLGIATVLLWLLARPGSERKWKLASSSALAAGALGLLVNQIIGAAWHRERPFAAHQGAHVWGHRSTDPSFPSDHASAAFGIAFAVFFFDRVVGSLFLAAAVLIAGGRVVVGEHYPLDVVAGLFVGLGAAIVVVRLAAPLIRFLVRLVERFTDPIVRPLWRRLPSNLA